MNELHLNAHAKINIGLDVVSRRPDGYHNVRMIMQTLGLHDKLTITRRETPGITIETNLSFLPVGEDNLIYRAGRLLMDEFHITEGVHVRLEKNIPVAAGMAGGSTDAAAMLCGINQMFQLQLSAQELMDRGVKIGADVPYCILRGTALSEGIGEILTPLPPMPECPVLIAKPGISVSTPFVYKNLKLSADTVHPDIDQLIEDIRQQDITALSSHMGNLLETVTIPNFPVIDEIKAHMLSHGAVGSMMSGSGPTVFGLFDQEDTARAAYEAMKESGLAKQVYLTTIFNTRSTL